MRLEMTVECATSTRGVDVVVSCSPGTPLAAAQPDLARLAGWDGADGPAVVVGGRAVPPEAELGAPPLLRGAVLELTAPGGGPRAGGGARATAELRVVAGPGAGARAVVPLGRAALGRDPASLLPLADRAVSRRHLDLDTSPRGTRVRDAGAANGALLDGRPLPREWVPLPPGALLVLGRTQLHLAPVGPRGRSRLRPDGRGHLLVPAVAADDVEDPGTTVIDLPAAPVPRPPSGTAWPAVLVPVVVAVPLALLWSPLALVLAASGPLVALLTRAGERVTRRREHRRALLEHEDASAAARTRAQRLVHEERRALDERHPDPAALRELVTSHDPRAWGAAAGSPLAVRLGSARRPTRVVLRSADGADRTRAAGRESGAAADEDGGERLHHAHGPLVVDLAATARLALVAPAGTALAVLRGLVAQLAVLHGPDAVQVRVVTDRPADWAWLRWLPHAGGGPLVPGAPIALSGDRAGDEDGAQRWVVVVDAAGSSAADAVGPVPAGGCVVVARPPGAASGPHPDADAVLHLDSEGAGTWTPVASAPLPLVTDLPDAAWAQGVARGLAAWRRPGAGSPTGGGPVPSLRELLSAHGADPGDAAAVAAAWGSRERGRSTRGGPGSAVPLGVHDDGRPWLVDLERDGPHALVAGTTGSGKSSLLVSLVLALAAAVPPDELAVVVVDYKGGATAGRLRGLPHLAGTVTDLDAHLARRALTSLTAEVRRRERVLAAHGASDRAELLARHDDGARLLPRLLVVVDEVRVLAEEVPELVPGLVRLAAVGRSLGVHLVLATQRPAGVVSADARANTNLRIALRVRDAPDSLDVVDDPGAAHLPAGAPGAALVRRGGEALQAVRVAAARSRPERPVRVELLGPEGVAASEDATGDDEVPVVVAALAEAARGWRRVVPPWLPALPEALAWRSPGEAPDRGAGDDGDDGGIPLALVDDPDAQRQDELRWPGRAPLAVLGGPRSGRTSLLRWLAAGAGTGGSHPPRDVHVVGDPAELGHLARLPRVRSVVDPGDGEHLLRLLSVLLSGAGSERVDDGGPLPLLLVDRADRVLGAAPSGGADGSSGGLVARAEADAAADLLRRLLDAGAPVVVTGEVSLLSSRALSAVREVLLLAPADRTAAVLAGVPSAAVPERWPAGRALRLRAGPVRECQLPVLGGVAGAAPGTGEQVQRQVVAELAEEAGRAGALDTGLRVPPLPRHLPLAQLVVLPPDPSGSAAPGSVAVGVGGPAAAPLGLPLPVGAGALVTGGPGSGRSSALRLLQAQAQRGGRPTVLLRPRAPRVVPSDEDAAGAVLEGTGTATAQALLDLVDGPAAGALVLLDDAELALGTPLEGALLTLLEASTPVCAVVAAGTSGLLPAHRGLVAALRRHRTGVLLHPLAPGDAELLGARASPVRAGPPGRASLVVAGALGVVQLAHA